MKRIFTIISVLITASLISIIFVQVSWIKNMALLRQEQIKHSIDEAGSKIAGELAKTKSSYASGMNKNSFLKDDFNLGLDKSPYSPLDGVDIGDLQRRMQKMLDQSGIRNINAELAISTSTNANDFSKETNSFRKMFEDTIGNYNRAFFIEALSGTPGESLSGKDVLYVVVPNLKSIANKSLRWRIAASVGFTLVILAAFYLTFITMLRQKKLAKIKNDFINNMTHEFKTPIATISLAVDAMRNDKVISNKEKLGYFSGIIKEENQRMNRQVETILKASQLEKQEVELALKPVHVHDIIKDVVDNFSLQLEEKKGRVELDLKAVNDLVDADEVHFSNLVNNLVDNALKYSRESVAPVVKVSTQSNGKKFSFRVEDNGIGMNRDTLKKIFERFYRAHTGNIHNVKGFGLGLSYVKTMVEAHDGDIKAESTLGKGSSFTVDLPLKRES